MRVKRANDLQLGWQLRLFSLGVVEYFLGVIDGFMFAVVVTYETDINVATCH